MIHVADFETTTVADDCRVWGWGLCALDDDWQTLGLDDVSVGTTLDTFIENLSDTNTTCYFHNLRFDGRFILDWLLKHDYEHLDGAGVRPGTFKTLISDMGQFYTITVRWENGTVTEFRDSVKKLPMTVAEIARTFNMEVQKGDIDYELPRPAGYQPTPAEADYIRRDVLIVARAIGQQQANGLTKLTVGADALGEFRKTIGTDNFARLFPTFSIGMDAEIRRAYRGGFTYADPRFAGRTTGAGLVLDVNSLYPSVMYNEALPYGEPEYVDGWVEPTKLRPLTIQAITFTARLKPGHIPCIQIKGTALFSATEYLSEVSEPTSLMVTNVDLQLMEDHYDLKILEYGGGWRFTAANGIFDSYIDKWTRVKMHSEGGMRVLAKLQLNSLYGKFATNPNVTGKVPYLDENGTVQLTMGPDEQRDPVYTPTGVFITSYARDITIRAAQANYSTFAYADTDSLHLLRDSIPDTISVHPSELGAWKHEYNFESAHYIRAKAYLERTTEGVYHNAIAGVPVPMSSVLTFDDLKHGRNVRVSHGQVDRWDVPEQVNVLMHGKLNPRAVPGGIILQNIPFELKL